MSFLPIGIIIILFMGMGSARLFSHARENDKLVADSILGVESDAEADDSDFSWEEPPVPDFLANYMDPTWWDIDTICVVNGKAYYHGNDSYGRNNVIYTLDELLCEDPTLYYASVDSNQKTTFLISTASKSVTVDFADRNSIEKLKTLVPKPRGAKRFSKSYLADFKDMVLYHMEIDYPENNTPADDNVRKWLVGLVNESMNLSEDVPAENAILIAYRKRNHGDWKYKGNIRDVNAIGKFASKKYFAVKKIEYEDDEYPFCMFNDLSLRLVSSNGKYFSYQRYTHDFNGGAHGYYMEEIVSFDPSRNEEIDLDYLFKPECESQILELFYKVVKDDPKFKQWVTTNTIAEIREHFENNSEDLCNGNIILPQPGLTDNGVVFSYQPYAISCFAAGCFHFTIPYELLKPYMTTKAKRMLNL